MSFSVGIGIVTYNRKAVLSDTIDQVRAFTRQPGAALVVADDGSGDGTLPMLREKQVPVITGVNMGIAWNKNRALFLLSQMSSCEGPERFSLTPVEVPASRSAMSGELFARLFRRS
jgi:glycosyltransferase involved in cell wall biosynthesis